MDYRAGSHNAATACVAGHGSQASELRQDAECIAQIFDQMQDAAAACAEMTARHAAGISAKATQLMRDLDALKSLTEEKRARDIPASGALPGPDDAGSASHGDISFAREAILGSSKAVARCEWLGERFSSAQSLPRNSNAWGAFRRYAFAPGASTRALSVVGVQQRRCPRFAKCLALRGVLPTGRNRIALTTSEESNWNLARIAV
jgi:hypothetical protein